jgi:general secretion pathway protein G
MSLRATLSQQLTRRRRAPRGMTLIEIIVVITILSLLMAAVGVAVIPRLEEAKVDRAKMDVRQIKDMLQTYYMKKGKYPDTGSGLKSLLEAQITEKALIDPWDHEYIYVLESGKPNVISYGKDGAPGGSEYDADVSLKELEAGKK